MEWLFLSILCPLFNLELSQADIQPCHYNRQCGIGLQCCRSTEGRGELSGEGGCRQNCDDFCLRNDDCVPPKRCDTSPNLCTTKCAKDDECPPNHECENKRCVTIDENNESGFIETPLVASAVLVFICCCVGLTIQRQRQNHTNSNGHIEAEAEAVERTLQVDESNGERDAIAMSGPPSYAEVLHSEPEEPPPTYEETLRISGESQPPTVEDRSVFGFSTEL